MSKSVLVIETPIDCYDCPVSTMTKEGGKWVAHCDPVGKFNKKTMEKPEWCPLRPMPEHKYETEAEVFSGTIKGIYRSSYYEGWNACLEEIEGE